MYQMDCLMRHLHHQQIDKKGGCRQQRRHAQQLIVRGRCDCSRLQGLQHLLPAHQLLQHAHHRRHSVGGMGLEMSARQRGHPEGAFVERNEEGKEAL